ncbi:MAG TPA: hypothetical protein PLB02_07420 [Thermoanaerobaculia bacterium]|nr:hypothetical protein [Thermoanaerobaculia bacterium]HQR67204.1 hypothetical protein [Thermoanaerobaculia bacterium]
MKRAACVGLLILCMTSAAARGDDDEATAHGWRLKGDRGETVKVLPSPHRVPSAAGHPVEAPVTGMTVYAASYGSGNLNDHGGLEIANAGFYQIYYDSTVPANITTGIDGFVNVFGSGVPDYKIIQQYGSHAAIAPTLANRGQFVDTKGVPSTISDSQIQSYLAGLFTSSTVPASASTIYGVYLPPGTTSTMGSSSSCTNYCGYHSVFTYGSLQIKYAVFPYLTCSGCSLSGRSVLDMLTIVTSHEIREAVTDPGDNGKNAWYDRRGYEADDKCAWHHLYTVGGYWVQPEYSNANKGCVVYP